MKDHEMLDILSQATASAYGIEIKVSDTKLFQQRFHRYRNKQRSKGDTSFDTLTCRIMTEDTIYLIHKGDDDESRSGESNS